MYLDVWSNLCWPDPYLYRWRRHLHKWWNIINAPIKCRTFNVKNADVTNMFGAWKGAVYFHPNFEILIPLTILLEVKTTAWEWRTEHPQVPNIFCFSKWDVPKHGDNLIKPERMFCTTLSWGCGPCCLNSWCCPRSFLLLYTFLHQTNRLFDEDGSTFQMLGVLILCIAATREY